VFALWPLGRAHDLPVSALFRDHLADAKLLSPRRRYLIFTGLVLAALVALMIATAPEKDVAAIFLAAAAAIFLLLRAVALGIMAVARRLLRPHRSELRIALA